MCLTVSARSLSLLCAVLALAAAVFAVPRPDSVAGDGLWANAASMTSARSNHSAVLLQDGTVLVAGGEIGNGPEVSYLSQAEIYDPASNTWSQTGSLATPRADFTLTLLPTGQVLAVGGVNASGPISSAELYNPQTHAWFSASTMSQGRSNHTATLLQDGRVLVAGGYGSSGPLSEVDVYDPATNSWSGAAPMTTARGSMTATRLSDGTVLVAGGFGTAGPLSSAEIYDPAANTWTPVASMAAARYADTATLLQDGRVLVAGGLDASGSSLNSAEIYDPVAKSWASAGSMGTARAYHTATRLATGQVLVAGGKLAVQGSSQTLQSAEVYDPATDRWSSAGSMSDPRQNHTATALQNGQVLVTGGTGLLNTLATAELFAAPGAAPTSTPTVTASTLTVTPETPTASPTPTNTPVSPTETTTPMPSATASPIPPTATATATSTPVPTVNFSILAVRVENNGGQPDWNLVHPPVSKVKVGSRVTLSIYVNFKSLPDNSQISIVSQVSLNGHIVHRAGLTSTMDRSDTGDLWSHTGFTPRATGKYVFSGTVTVNKKSRSVSTSFSVVKQTVTPPPVSFQFTDLRALDSRGRSATTFSFSDRVAIVATWTVRNLAGTAPVLITETLEYPTAKGWRPLGQPLQNSFDTSSGSHSFRFTFVPSTSFSSLRIAIGITIGGKTQQRTYTIRLHR